MRLNWSPSHSGASGTRLNRNETRSTPTERVSLGMARVPRRRNGSQLEFFVTIPSAWVVESLCLDLQPDDADDENGSSQATVGLNSGRSAPFKAKTWRCWWCWRSLPFIFYILYLKKEEELNCA